MKKIISLNELPLGQKGVIYRIACAEGEKRRMMELGFAADTEVEALLKSPCGDPVAYLVKGAVMAVRNEDAEKIEIIRNEFI